MKSFEKHIEKIQPQDYADGIPVPLDYNPGMNERGFFHTSNQNSDEKIFTTPTQISSLTQSWDGEKILMGALSMAFLMPTNNFNNEVISQFTKLRIGNQSAYIRAMAFHPSDVLCGISHYNTLHLYDSEKNLFVSSLSGHKSTITGVLFSSDGKTLVTSGIDQKLLTYDLIKSQQYYEIKLPHEATSLSTNLNESMVSLSMSNGQIYIFDNRQQNEAIKFQAHSNYITSSKFSKFSENLIASAGSDRAVKLFDVRQTVSAVCQFYRHSSTPTCVEFDNVGNLWCGSRNAELQAWDLNTFRSIYRNLVVENGAVLSIMCSDLRNVLLVTTSAASLLELKLKNRNEEEEAE
ncbi:TIR domain-containing protein [Histomonas meleagridis]|uniref:TIR domain-containing protein n=1 Tax=Histomonas meleagridis TaxID=135588 RepID=UPI003559BBE7|nr:TIR domain-containing protein [Histomonas meleagridis]KAH0805078.1 TIR domain-containing protein [Histomonas meleagridis]